MVLREIKMYPIISFAGRQIGTYALLGIIGILVSATFAAVKLKKSNILPEDVIIYTLVGALGALIGGHILYAMVNYKLIIKAFAVLVGKKGLKSFIKIIFAAFGGSVFYGSFFGMVAVIWLSLRKNKNKLIILDTMAVVMPLFHIFGRIGCFFGGCCYGIESKIGFIVQNNPISPDICGVKRFPVALLEAFINLIIFLILNRIFDSKKHTGKLLFFYGVLYPPARFMLEFLRGDVVRGIFLNLSTSQWISIAFFIISLFILINKRKSKKSTEINL